MHGVADQLRLVVDGLQPDAGRQGRGDRGHDSGHAVREGKGVAAHLPRDVEQRRRPAVSRDDADVVLRPQPNRRDVAHPQPVSQDHALDIVRPVRFLVGHDQVLPVVLRDPAHRLYRHRLADRVSQVPVRHALGRKAGRVRDHLDLPHIRPLHLDAADAGNARDQGLDFVAGEVVQRRRVTALEVIRQNRKQGRGELLYLEVEPRGQVGGRLIHARPHQLDRVPHVRARRERYRDLAPAPDRVRPDPRHARHNAHRFFERTGDAEYHLARSERRALGDDGNAGEHQLWIDGGRQSERGPRTGGAEQADQQIDEPALPAQHVEQIHRGARRICAPSATPYAPVVTTVSPASSPARISTRASVRAPTVTGRVWATPPESTTNT